MLYDQDADLVAIIARLLREAANAIALFIASSFEMKNTSHYSQKSGKLDRKAGRRCRKS
jgi:hypothetical protein